MKKKEPEREKDRERERQREREREGECVLHLRCNPMAADEWRRLECIMETPRMHDAKREKEKKKM